MKRRLLSLGAALALTAPFALPLTVSAVGVDIYGACPAGSTDAICQNKDEKVQPIFKNIINLLLLALGAIAVIMIVVGGIQYTTSGGDSNKVTSAKNTILYSAVGVVVALLAYTIVNFVFNAVTTK
ncbi:MAG: pilin [Candidatus Saccharibacteria bacterium]|nr:pilin [Candidatus Saccharibacteria bacterium]